MLFIVEKRVRFIWLIRGSRWHLLSFENSFLSASELPQELGLVCHCSSNTKCIRWLCLPFYTPFVFSLLYALFLSSLTAYGSPRKLHLTYYRWNRVAAVLSFYIIYHTVAFATAAFSDVVMVMNDGCLLARVYEECLVGPFSWLEASNVYIIIIYCFFSHLFIYFSTIFLLLLLEDTYYTYEYRYEYRCIHIYIYIHVYEYIYICIYIFMCAWCFSSSDEYESYMYIYIYYYLLIIRVFVRLLSYSIAPFFFLFLMLCTL